MNEVNLDNIDMTKENGGTSTIKLLEDRLKDSEEVSNKSRVAINGKNKELYKLEEDLINNVFPKSKSILAGIGEDLDIGEDKTFMLKEKNVDTLFVKGEPLKKPRISGGGIKAFLFSLVGSLTAAGTAVLTAASELNIVIEQNKLIEFENAKAIVSYIGDKSSIANILQLDNNADNYLSGLGVLIGGTLLVFLLMFLMLKLYYGIKSKNKMNHYQDSVRDRLSELSKEEEETANLNSYLRFHAKLISAVKVLLEEKNSQLERVIFFEEVTSEDKTLAQRKISSIKALVEKSIDQISVELVEDNGINEDYHNKLKEFRILVNNYIEDIYGDKNISI